MTIYWTYKSLPEFAGVPDVERERIWRAVQHRGNRHWQTWAAAAGYFASFYGMVWIVEPAVRHIRDRALTWGGSPLLCGGIVYAGGLMMQQVMLRHLRPHIRRELPGRCRGCGYDLTGNTSGVCPECGAPVA